MADLDRSTKKRTVMVAMDGSRHSDNALQWYLENFHHSDDRVIIAYCDEPFQLTMDVNLSLANAMLEDHRQKLQKTLESIEAEVKALKLVHTLERLRGYPGEAIVKAAKDLGADMIVCGSRGHGVIRRTILGSVSHYILKHAHIPVLVCKHENTFP